MGGKRIVADRVEAHVGAELDSLQEPTTPPTRSPDKPRTYPEWAPKQLIEFLPRLQKYNTGFDSEKYLAAKGLSGDELRNLSRRIYDRVGSIPPSEGAKLYELLLTDDRMEKVWAAIARRAKSDTDSIQFAIECNIVQAEWRASPNLTRIASQRLFLEIEATALKLSKLMQESIKLSDFPLHSFLDAKFARNIKESLALSNMNYDEHLAEYFIEQTTFAMPSFLSVLSDIQKQASVLAARIPTVRHPNSINAECHHFARRISEYFSRTYKSPLHEHVATTTCVVLGVENVTAAAVRQLISSSTK